MMLPYNATKNKLLTRIVLLVLLLGAAASAVGQVDRKVYPAPDFGPGSEWLDGNTQAPHHISEYRGQVVLIDFWEYTCINCIRDFEVLKHWYTKYHSYGFEIIGVHYGEFNIGFDVNNVRIAAQKFHLPWPVVADQKGTTWKAYASDGWPNRYLLDPQGKVVMKVFGEGNNREMEEEIRDLLAVAHPEVKKLELDPDENSFRPECGSPTAEILVGESHGSGTVEDLAGHHTAETVDFVPPHSPSDGGVMLVGRWSVDPDGVTSQGNGAEAGAEIRYHARSLYAVLSPTRVQSVRVSLFQDGLPMPKENAGADVKFDNKGAYIEVSEARMYYLQRGPAFSGHLVSLQPVAPGLTLHSFAFGNNCQLSDQP
jgi:thiol-disulfide isomerase/thioredoxin